MDFLKNWTDAQLESALHLPAIIKAGQDKDVQAEIDRRTAAGIPDDGSKARVEEFATRIKTNRRRRSAR